MYSFQLYRRKGPFSGSSPESIIGLSSNRGCLTGSSLVPITTREADGEEPAPEPQPASNPPAAAVPVISLSASRRDMRRREGDLSLGWNAISISLLSGRPPRTAPSLPLGRDLLPPGALFPVSLSERVEAQLPARRAKTHLVGQFSAHRRVVEQHLERETVHERGEVRSETLGVARPELAGALALPYHLRNRVAPAAFERLALAGRLLVAQSPRPQLDPQRPVLITLAPYHRRTRQLDQAHQPMRSILDARQLPESLYVEKVLRIGERLGKKRLLGPEVVHYQSRTQTSPIRHVSDARVAKTTLRDHLHGRLQHLRAALLRQFGPGPHSPPTLYFRTCERLFNVQR